MIDTFGLGVVLDKVIDCAMLCCAIFMTVYTTFEERQLGQQCHVGSLYIS